MMERKQKSGLLLAAAIAGFVFWIVPTVLIFIELKRGPGFIEVISNLVKSLTDSGEGSGITRYMTLAYFVLLAASVLSFIAWLKGGKIPAYIAALLHLVSCNFISPILCVIGAKPRFLEGRKTALFVAGYIGVIFLLLWIGLGFIPDIGTEIFFTIFELIMLAAIIFNFFAWRKTSALMALIAGIIHAVSGLGIPSAILCFITYAKLEKPFLQGKKTILFVSLCIGIALLLLCMGSIFTPDAAGSEALFAIIGLITLAAVIFNFLAWQKNSTHLTLIAAILYILSGLGIIPAVLCFIGRVRLKKLEKIS